MGRLMKFGGWFDGMVRWQRICYVMVCELVEVCWFGL